MAAVTATMCPFDIFIIASCCGILRVAMHIGRPTLTASNLGFGWFYREELLHELFITLGDGNLNRGTWITLAEFSED
jgi:hypothetical protein